jgi:hypothetical protein
VFRRAEGFLFMRLAITSLTVDPVKAVEIGRLAPGNVCCGWAANRGWFPGRPSSYRVASPRWNGPPVPGKKRRMGPDCFHLQRRKRGIEFCGRVLKGSTPLQA